MIKDFDTFEANLVMSTLSPEDAEFECQQSRAVAQSHLQNSTTENIVLDKTIADGGGDADAVGGGDNAGNMSRDLFLDKNANTHEDDQPNNSNAVIAKKRNRFLASGHDSFESSISKRPSLDIVLRNNRQTLNENRRNTHLPSANGSRANNQTEHLPSAPSPHVDLESENIEVVFQDEDDSPDPNNAEHAPDHRNNAVEHMDVDTEPNIHHNAIVRDHRPKVRQVFQLCYSGNTPKPDELYGNLLAEASDDER